MSEFVIHASEAARQLIVLPHDVRAFKQLQRKESGVVRAHIPTYATAILGFFPPERN